MPRSSWQWKKVCVSLEGGIRLKGKKDGWAYHRLLLLSWSKTEVSALKETPPRKGSMTSKLAFHENNNTNIGQKHWNFLLRFIFVFGFFLQMYWFQRSAKRLIDYWDCKLYLFGEDKCFLPLTLNCALKDDLSALSSGVIRILPTKDKFDRAMLLISPMSLDYSRYTRESMVSRSSWFGCFQMTSTQF